MKTVFVIVFLLCVSVSAQEPQVCISQTAANKCAENARLVPTLEAKIVTLEEGLKQKDTSIEELKEANRKNVADLTERVHKTEAELAVTKGQLIGAEAMVTRLTAIIDFMLKNGREKCYSLICIQ